LGIVLVSLPHPEFGILDGVDCSLPMHLVHLGLAGISEHFSAGAGANFSGFAGGGVSETVVGSVVGPLLPSGLTPPVEVMVMVMAGECEAQIQDGWKEFQEGAQVQAIFSSLLEKNACQKCDLDLDP
jgi:hypothetical protein